MEKSGKNTVISAYAVQCAGCFKWRVIPTKEEYETIREKFSEDPWFCNRKPNVCCDDPADIEYSSKQIWAIDKPNLPKSPADTQRLLSMRSDLSKMDVQYIMPNGKRVRSSVEVEKFLDANPEYRNKFSSSNFSFTSPKVFKEMVPNSEEGKASAIKIEEGQTSAIKSEKGKASTIKSEKGKASAIKSEEGEASIIKTKKMKAGSSSASDM